MNQRRMDFIAYCVDALPAVIDGVLSPKHYYLWGRKGPESFDCSGFVTYGLHTVGGPDWRDTHFAGRLWRELPIATRPTGGDLCFYGSPGVITHVMVWMPDGCVIGASGGNSDTTTVEIAHLKRAFVKKRGSKMYRPDFRGFRHFSPLDG